MKTPYGEQVFSCYGVLKDTSAHPISYPHSREYKTQRAMDRAACRMAKNPKVAYVVRQTRIQP